LKSINPKARITSGKLSLPALSREVVVIEGVNEVESDIDEENDVDVVVVVNKSTIECF